MCGLVGILNIDGKHIEQPAAVEQMASKIVHRGPDDVGFLVDGPVAFGFRRLSIIDLETGHQPVSNEKKDIWVMLNGEIYNYLGLRRELEAKGHHFVTRSDTEVIVHAYESFGEHFVDKLRGMFVIALWDSKRKLLFLVRDRVGQKPLFYGQKGNQLAFASEIKALTEWPEFARDINREALHDYLSLLYIPAPKSIFEGIYKLEPASMLIADVGRGSYALRRYWEPLLAVNRSWSMEEYASGLKEILREAVRIRLRSDVPLGAFLSGGIDSSVVVGLMAQYLPTVRTFSIGFSDPRFDERGYARHVASKFQTQHIDSCVDADNFTPDDLINLVWYMDEPFADSSFIPTYWVAQAARRHVAVALSGDGGDELFAGYNIYRYFYWVSFLARIPFLPEGMLGTISGIIRRLVQTFWLSGAEKLRRIGKAFALGRLDEIDRIIAMSTYFEEGAKSNMYSPEWRSRLGRYSTNAMMREQLSVIDGDGLARYMAWDFMHHLADGMLTKVDRASMACSLEVRSPFLDHQVVEWAIRMPINFKLRGGSQKIVLKHAFRDLLPVSILNRKKHGFELPFASWFRKQNWRSLLVDMLSEQRIREQGIFDPTRVVEIRDILLKDPEALHLPVSAYQLRHRVWIHLILQIWWDHFIRP